MWWSEDTYEHVCPGGPCRSGAISGNGEFECTPTPISPFIEGVLLSGKRNKEVCVENGGIVVPYWAVEKRY